ncbi:MAG: hypothetical protein WC807_20850 [Hyphomicrobium sp.]|jgi:hypothetical protein
MAKNDTHPLFRKDEALVDEFNDWFFHNAAQVSDLPKKRQILETLDRTNSIGRDAKQKTIAELDMLDEAHGINPDGPPPHSEQFSQAAGTTAAAYQKQRAEIFTRYSGVNDRLWKQRESLGAELDHTLDRQQLASSRPRVRMPTRIIQAARIAATQHQATNSSAYDQLMQKGAPALTSKHQFNRDRDQERD